ncbi:SHOCT domain-containing protein [Kaistella sp.]|uniref:SHOCT domain-containing protein n=1 Tax=Kaistella sp. TaxID=2782235 RepID=UPI003C3FA577
MYNYTFGGMHLIWWFVWIVFIFWIFFTPWYIPGNRRNIDSPLDILKKRFASGEISKEQYLEQKKILETN